MRGEAEPVNGVEPSAHGVEVNVELLACRRGGTPSVSPRTARPRVVSLNLGTFGHWAGVLRKKVFLVRCWGGAAHSPLPVSEVGLLADPGPPFAPRRGAIGAIAAATLGVASHPPKKSCQRRADGRRLAWWRS